MAFVQKFLPELNKVYFINKNTLFHILHGRGGIQVDFANYFDWQDKLIYLEKGQYIKFLSSEFTIRRIEFNDTEVFENKEVRVLFKHLVSLGYINFRECHDCQKFLGATVMGDVRNDIIDISSEQWYWQNPFGAQKDEYHIIFDVKDLVDIHYSDHLSTRDVVDLMAQQGHQVQELLKNKVGLSIKRMMLNKMILESKKDVAFTDKTIQEIAYDSGFKDPPYFNRFFQKETGQTPLEFRKGMGFQKRDYFTEDILKLIDEHHHDQHSLDFYADKMNVSVKTLSRKVREKLNTTLGHLIRSELIGSAKRMLEQETSIKEISRILKFEEPNHFTRFFKNSTGQTPSHYRKKYNT